MKRLKSLLLEALTPRNQRILYIVLVLASLAISAGAPGAGSGTGGGGGLRYLP